MQELETKKVLKKIKGYATIKGKQKRKKKKTINEMFKIYRSYEPKK
jgi:hypothetical protein